MNRFKNDVFCLGLTLLELGLLKSVNKVVTKDGLFDFNQLKTYMHQFEAEYANNNLLVAMVRAMIEVVPQKRPTFIGKIKCLFYTICILINLLIFKQMKKLYNPKIIEWNY